MSKEYITTIKIWLATTTIILLAACNTEDNIPVLDRNKLANEYYQEDQQWYLDNTPFF